MIRHPQLSNDSSRALAFFLSYVSKVSLFSNIISIIEAQIQSCQITEEATAYTCVLTFTHRRIEQVKRLDIKELSQITLEDDPAVQQGYIPGEIEMCFQNGFLMTFRYAVCTPDANTECAWKLSDLFCTDHKKSLFFDFSLVRAKNDKIVANTSFVDTVTSACLSLSCFFYYAKYFTPLKDFLPLLKMQVQKGKFIEHSDANRYHLAFQPDITLHKYQLDLKIPTYISLHCFWDCPSLSHTCQSRKSDQRCYKTKQEYHMEIFDGWIYSFCACAWNSEKSSKPLPKDEKQADAITLMMEFSFSP